jgi:hypothetical protein
LILEVMCEVERDMTCRYYHRDAALSVIEYHTTRNRPRGQRTLARMQHLTFHLLPSLPSECVPLSLPSECVPLSLPSECVPLSLPSECVPLSLPSGCFNPLLACCLGLVFLLLFEAVRYFPLSLSPTVLPSFLLSLLLPSLLNSVSCYVLCFLSCAKRSKITNCGNFEATLNIRIIYCTLDRH